MLLEDLNWMDVEKYLQNDDRLLLVTGSCEQHGYLSLLTDAKIPLAIAAAAAQQTGVLVAPPVNFGLSPYFTAYPGTLSLRVQTLLAVVEDLVRGAHAQGFRRLFFVNGHGGNAPAAALLAQLVNDLPGLQAEWYSWWTAPAVTAAAAQAGLASNHANWIEAFPFCRVAELPQAVKPDVAAPRILDAVRARRLYGDGVFGGPYQASPEVMDAVFAAAVGDVVRRLEFREEA